MLSSMKERRSKSIKNQLKPMAPIIRSWFLQVGFELIESKEFSVTEEMLIEEVTEFYIKKLKELEDKD